MFATRFSASFLESLVPGFAIRSTFANLLNMPQSHLCCTKVTRYEEGQSFLSHKDCAEKKNYAGSYPGVAVPYANRCATLFVYLNDVAEGGKTLFTDLRREFGKVAEDAADIHEAETLAVRPEQGMGVLFFPGFLATAKETYPEADKRGISPGGPDWRFTSGCRQLIRSTSVRRLVTTVLWI